MFVAMVRQTPDYPILFGAASLIGAVVNFVNPGFDKDYISELINASDADIVFVNDWDFADVSYSLKKSCTNKRIILLTTSKWDIYDNPFHEITDCFFKFDVISFKTALAEFTNVIELDRFLEEGENFDGELDGHTTLDDDTVICYTSGSTKVGIHKGVPLKNRTYLVMGRYHDPEVSGMPSMKDIVTLSAIDTQADVTLLSGLSDTFMQGGTMALDPIINKDYLLYSLQINGARLAVATRSFWLSAMKEYYSSSKAQTITLPEMYVPSVGGEPLSAGEEIVLNRWLKDVKAGTNITHTPFSIIVMSIGGGDTENGNIFLQLFRKYKSIPCRLKGIKEPIGMSVYDYATVKAIRTDGTYCDPMENGHLVAQSPLAMDGYYNCTSENALMEITDAYGVVWRDLANYGYMDKNGNVYLKGRISPNDPDIKNFEISDIVLQNSKRVMSCETVFFNDVYVVHIEKQFGKNVDTDELLSDISKQLKKTFGDSLDGKVYFRIRTSEEGFPISYTTKRNVLSLKQEGVSDKCVLM